MELKNILYAIKYNICNKLYFKYDFKYCKQKIRSIYKICSTYLVFEIDSSVVMYKNYLKYKLKYKKHKF